MLMQLGVDYLTLESCRSRTDSYQLTRSVYFTQLVSPVHDIPGAVVPSVLFWQNEVFVREPASFQLSLYSLPGGLQSLKLTSIQLYWNEHKRPVVIEHCDDSDIHSIIQVGDLYSNSLSNASGAGTSDDAVKANLRWHETDPKVLAGAITSSVSAELKV
jgi:hypothetical protein